MATLVNWNCIGTTTSSTNTVFSWSDDIQSCVTYDSRYQLFTNGTSIASRSTAHEQVTPSPQRRWPQAETDEARQERERQQAERESKLKDAEAKAVALLEEHLSPDQLKAFRNISPIPVQAVDGREFLLLLRRDNNILELDAEGKPHKRYCARPGHATVPLCDSLLTQILYLRSQPEEMLRKANWEYI